MDKTLAIQNVMLAEIEQAVDQVLWLWWGAQVQAETSRIWEKSEHAWDTCRIFLQWYLHGCRPSLDNQLQKEKNHLLITCNISNTSRVFHLIFKRREVGWKNKAYLSFFNQLQGVSKSDQILFQVFDIQCRPELSEPKHTRKTCQLRTRIRV